MHCAASFRSSDHSWQPIDQHNMVQEQLRLDAWFTSFLLWDKAICTAVKHHLAAPYLVAMEILTGTLRPELFSADTSMPRLQLLIGCLPDTSCRMNSNTVRALRKQKDGRPAQHVACVEQINLQVLCLPTVQTCVAITYNNEKATGAQCEGR
jgi:hypothetical protein